MVNELSITFAVTPVTLYIGSGDEPVDVTFSSKQYGYISIKFFIAPLVIPHFNLYSNHNRNEFSWHLAGIVKNNRSDSGTERLLSVYPTPSRAQSS